MKSGMYARVIGLKAMNPDLKVMLVLGGWTDSGDDSYSRLASDARARSMFVSHAAGFVKGHGFDGLHLDWQYPVCWQADCSKGPAVDRTNYPVLAKVREDETEACKQININWKLNRRN